MADLFSLAFTIARTIEKRNRLYELQRPTADHFAEVAEYGEFNEAGGTLSRADFEDAQENL